jgi:RNA polymerase sigma factor (sigma-70 family)
MSECVAGSPCAAQPAEPARPDLHDPINLVRKVARRYAPAARRLGIDVEDQVGEGYVGLVRACEVFGPADGYELSTIAWRRISAAIIRALQQQRGRRLRRLPVIENDEGEVGAYDPPDERHTVEAGTSEDVHWLLAQLPPRQALILRQYFGLGDGNPRSLSQIAHDLGICRSRAQVLFSQAMATLRTLAAADFFRAGVR